MSFITMSSWLCSWACSFLADSCKTDTHTWQHSSAKREIVTHTHTCKTDTHVMYVLARKFQSLTAQFCTREKLAHTHTHISTLAGVWDHARYFSVHTVPTQQWNRISPHLVHCCCVRLEHKDTRGTSVTWTSSSFLSNRAFSSFSVSSCNCSSSTEQHI